MKVYVVLVEDQYRDYFAACEVFSSKEEAEKYIELQEKDNANNLIYYYTEKELKTKGE